MEENTTQQERLAKRFAFTAADFAQIDSHGISLDKIETELALFANGIPKVHLEKPATINDGILKLSDAEFCDFAQKYDLKKETLKLNKFVPASGAASRMFKFLNEFLNEFNPDEETINAYINRKKDKNLPVFLAGIEKFPFYDAVKARLKELYPDYYTLESHQKSYRFIHTLLDPAGFDYCNKPKGVLPFHQYSMHSATAVEEHLNECAAYASANHISHLHLTVSENHKQLFVNCVEKAKDKIEKRTGTATNTSFSYQHKSTDTIAVDMHNKPFRNESGSLVFRPGGHGALINNLNALDADVVFIKNIDNVIQNHIEEIALYKKALAAVLLDLQQQVFSILTALESGQATADEILQIFNFMQQKLHIDSIEGIDKYTTENKIEYIKTQLNRPIRVCGMVKNEGEPGGGPFWVRSQNGTISLQIVESVQVDVQNPEQAEILQKATHFNPVDLVCGIKDYKGQKFDLLGFVDHSTGFIVHKNNKGNDLKAYELPGLWNGAMAKWITLFVEVPLITFNPVKTVNDLLKPAHQPQYEN